MRTLTKIMALATALVVTTATALGAIPMPNPASSFGLQFDTVYTGDAPGGPAPWMNAFFLDENAPGSEDNTIWLAINANGLQTGEFVGSTYFNYAPKAGYATSLSAVEYGTVGVVTTTSIGTALGNAYNAGANYKFDVSFEYETANNTPGRFQDEEWVAYTITGPVGSKLSALDFLAASFKNNQPPGPLAAAHLQGFASGGSAWVEAHETGIGPVPFVVPEPSTYALLAGLGLVGFAGYRRFKK